MLNREYRESNKWTCFLMTLFFVICVCIISTAQGAYAANDTDGPVISDVTVVEAGQTLGVGDTIHVSATITDESVSLMKVG